MISIYSVSLLFTVFFVHDVLSFQIHVFGDSHASFCFSNDRTEIPRNEISWFKYINNTQNNISVEFAIHWFGSKTMFSIGRDSLQILNLKSLGVLDGDVSVFVFGEIDVRCHIGKQRDLHNRELGEVINSLAKSFLEAIKNNQIMFKRLFCVVVSVTPPTNNYFNWVYPYHGTLDDRSNITRQLNSKLKELCNEYGFDFLDIHALYANEEGILDDNVSDGVVHVNPRSNDQIKKSLIDLLITKHSLFQNV